jgi:hypothetical protein
VVYQDGQFLMESIHQVISTDLDNDGVPEVIITGKNYTAREVFIYWSTINSDFKPMIQWQSNNLCEDRSVLWVCTGKFNTEQNQLLAVTTSRLYFYQYGKDGLTLAKQKIHNFIKILSVAGGDINGDGHDELVIARIGKITNKFNNCILQVWQLNDAKPLLLTESDLLGNIRSLSAGDLDGDGKSEIIIEEGLRFAPGNIHIYRFSESKLKELSCARKVVSGAIYSMTVVNFKEEVRLVTASTSGKVKFFMWGNNTLIPIGSGISFDGELVSVTGLTSNRDRIPELIVVSYPQNLFILSANVPEK